MPANVISRADSRPVVRIGGREHQDWTSYSIDSDLLTAADAFSLNLGVAARDIPPEF